MRICVLTSCYPRWQGDFAGSFVHSLASALNAQFGVRSLVIAPHEAGLAKRERRPGIEIRRFQYAWPAKRQKVAYGSGIPDNLAASRMAKAQAVPFALRFLAAAFEAAPHCDLIHANWVEPGFLGWVASRFFRKPLVTTVHSLNPLAKASLLYKAALAGSDCVLFNSSYTESLAKKIAPGAKGEVLFQGIDVHRFRAERTDRFRSRLGVHPGGLLIASVGRLIHLKGHDRLVAAMGRKRPALEKAHVAIAGDGPERMNLEAAIARAGMQGRVHLLGRVATGDIPALLADSDIYAHPAVFDASGRTEAMGLAVCEAMATGLPCVASRAGGLPDLVVDGQTGFLVEPGDADALAAALECLILSPETRQRMGRASRQRASEAFSWESIAKRTYEIYRSLLQSRR